MGGNAKDDALGGGKFLRKQMTNSIGAGLVVIIRKINTRQVGLGRVDCGSGPAGFGIYDGGSVEGLISTEKSPLSVVYR